MRRIEDVVAELDRKLLGLIRDALAEDTASRAPHGDEVTGNAYQAMRIGGAEIAGFRRRDASLLAGLDLAGKRFVDLCCNLGEVTRHAARAGAALAEGIEAEELFVRLAGLANVANGLGNAVVRRGDVTQPGCLAGEYDVGACFSAFRIVERHLEDILERVGGLFLLETEPLDEAWYDAYVARIEPLLPCWAVLGFTDAATESGAGAWDAGRALILFGRSAEEITLSCVRRCDALGTGHPDVRWLDVARSRRAESLWGEAPDTQAFFARLRGTLATLSASAPHEVAAALRPALPELEQACDAHDFATTHFGSDRYWLALLQGLVETIDFGEAVPGNPYVAFLRRLSAAGEYDPGMAYELADDGRALRRLAPRLERFLDILRTRALEHPLAVYNPFALPQLETFGYRPGPAQRDEHVVLRDGGGFRLQLLDGNHRLAALWLSGAERCPVLPVWTNVFGLGREEYRLFDADYTQEAYLPRLLVDNVLAAATAATARARN